MSKKEIKIPEPSKSQYKNRLILSIIVGVLGFLIYINTTGHGYVYDDDAIVDNLFVQQGISGIPKLFTVDFWYFENVKLGYYRPLSLATSAFENQIFGNNPHVGHFDNALLFGITGFILCFFLTQLFAGKNPVFAFLICLVFVAHPIHTEVVANIKSRDELLSFLNTICMIFFAYRFSISKKQKYLVWSLIFFYLSLLSKETAAVGIILLPVFLYFSGTKIPDILKKLLPYVGVVILFFLQKRYFLGSDAVVLYADPINYPYTSSGVKLPTAFHIFVICLGKLIFPYPLTYDYSFNQIPASHWTDVSAFLGAIVFIGLGILAAIGLWRKTIWGLGLSFLLITIIPSLAFVFLRGGILAERFLYAPCFGFAILLIYFLLKAFPKPVGEKKDVDIIVWAKSNMAPTGIIIAVSLIFSIETIARNNVWKDDFTLFSHDVAASNESCMAHNNYGINLSVKAAAEKDSTKRKQYFDLALGEFNKAIAIYPEFQYALFQIGYAYQSVEINKDSALKYYKRCVDVPPGYAKAYNNLGILYQNARKPELASYYYNKAIELDPKFEEAKKHAADFKKMTGLDVHEFPGGDTVSLNKKPEINPPAALTQEDLNKFNQYFTQGAKAAEKGDYTTGIKYFKKAATIIPDNQKNLLYLANSYGMIKHYQDAVNTFEFMLKKYPDDQMVIKNLGITYDLMGQKGKGDEMRKKLKDKN